MTAALPMQRNFTDFASSGPIRVHDFIGADVVGDEVEAVADYVDGVDLVRDGIFLGEVELLDDGG